jgi:hypothetical protein
MPGSLTLLRSRGIALSITRYRNTREAYMVAVPIIISCLALAVSIIGTAYGIVERKGVARRLERIRLSELLDSLNQVDLQLAQSKEQSGSVIVALNTRNELLAQQILTLRPEFEQELISVELRTLAHGLALANYWDDAGLAWEWAEKAARNEGPAQQLLALRGRAYYLFKGNRAAEARALLSEAEGLNPLSNDGYRSLAATTLLDWSSYEFGLGDPVRASELIDQAEEVLVDLELEGIRRQIRDRVDAGRRVVAESMGDVSAK